MLPMQPPGGGSDQRYHWPYCSTAKGTDWHAYLWGPIHWFKCHKSQRTKPCLTELTSGELTCSLCATGWLAESVGYVPLVREKDGRPVFVIVGEEVLDTLGSSKWQERVIVGRGTEATDRCYVIPAPVQKPWVSSLRMLAARADLTHTLLRVWRIAELAEWYYSRHPNTEEQRPANRSLARTPGPASTTAELERIESETPAELVEKARRQRAELAERESARALGESLPSTNGKHKPDRKGG